MSSSADISADMVKFIMFMFIISADIVTFVMFLLLGVLLVIMATVVAVVYITYTEGELDKEAFGQKLCPEDNKSNAMRMALMVMKLKDISYELRFNVTRNLWWGVVVGWAQRQTSFIWFDFL